MAGLRQLKTPLSQVMGSLKVGYLRPHSGQASWRSGRSTDSELVPCQEKSVLLQQQGKAVALSRRLAAFEQDLLTSRDAEGGEFLTANHLKEVSENDDSLPTMVECHRVLAIVSPTPLGGHAFDPFMLPLQAFRPSADDIHIQECNTTIGAIIRDESPAAVFTGFLDASPYRLYCIGSDKDSLLGAFSPSLFSDFEQQIMVCADPRRDSRVPVSGEKVSEDVLSKVSERLSQSLSTFFIGTHDYGLYHKNIIFQNGIRGVTTHGLPAYVQQLALVKLLGRLRYAHIKVELLKVTQHTEDGTVRIRWRIVGVPGLRVLLLFWQYKVWEWTKMMNSSDWIDGFSIFHVGGDGLIYKHICDKVIPDQNREEAKPSNMALKLALLLGLMPKSELLEDMEMLCRTHSLSLADT